MTIRSIQPNLAGYETQRLEQTGAHRQEALKTGSRPESSADRISISDAGRTQANAFKAAQDSDGVRPDKVADIKARLAAGTYQPDSRDIATKMVRQELDVWG